MNQNDKFETPSGQGSKDGLLANLVNGVNQFPGFEMGITLHVNGLIISGMLCSTVSFLKEQAELIRRIGSPNTQEFADIFGSFAEAALPQDADQDGDDGQEPATEEQRLPDFIHLRAATVHAPGTSTVLPETLWRGQLDHVSGWSIGTFGIKSPALTSTAQ